MPEGLGLRAYKLHLQTLNPKPAAVLRQRSGERRRAS